MTIDERLDRLTERHEALTQSLELLTHDVKALESVTKDIAEGTVRLLHVAQIHEQRRHARGEVAQIVEHFAQRLAIAAFNEFPDLWQRELFENGHGQSIVQIVEYRGVESRLLYANSTNRCRCIRRASVQIRGR